MTVHRTSANQPKRMISALECRAIQATDQRFIVRGIERFVS